MNLLVKWNKVMNLVGPASWQAILTTLIVDSFYLSDFVQKLPLGDEPECRDLGSGAGLPGIALRMLWQKGRYTLVESREKRALFLRACLAALVLQGVSVFHGRAEKFMADAPRAQLTISRAFLPWEQVLGLVAPFTDTGGICLFLTLAPLPDPPPGWSALTEARYQVGRDIRYFWAMQKK